MSMEKNDVIDVESRVVSVNTDDSSAAATETTPVQQVVLLEQSLVPAFEAEKQIALANPAIVQLNALKAEISAAKVQEINVGTKEGEERVRALLKRCVKLRTGTDAAYKAWNRPLLDAQKGVRRVVEQVAEGISPEETELASIIQKIDDAREAERQRKIDEEQARIAALRQKISALIATPVAAVKLTSAEIDTEIRALQDLAITDAADSFGEFFEEADGVRAGVISQLLEMSRSKLEAEQRKAALDAEAARQREAAKQAEIERGLRAKIDAIKAKAFEAFGKTAKQLDTLRSAVRSMEPLPLEFGDLYVEAMRDWNTAFNMVNNAYVAQVASEERQAEQDRVAAEQETERKRLAAEAKARAEEERQRLAAANPPAPAPTPAPAPAPTPTPTLVTDEDRDESTMPAGVRGDEALDLALASATPAQISDAAEQLAAGLDLEPELTMSMFASLEDYYAAKALRSLREVWGDEHAAVNVIAGDILNVLATGDFPTEQASELDLISLLLHEPVLECLRARRAALIAAVNTNTDQVTA